MAKEVLLFVVVVVLSCYVQPVPADVHCYDPDTSASWTCSYECCSDKDYCCTGGGEDIAAAYWYAWVLIAVGVLLCVCSCVGCGTYGYRRQHYRVIHNPPVYRTVVTESPAPIQRTGYQPVYGSGFQAPPPYNPSAHK